MSTTHPTQIADLDEIVFEGREKAYGAYQIRKKHDRILERAALLTFLTFISLTALPKVIDWVSPDEMMLTVTEIEVPPMPETMPFEEPEEPEPLTKVNEPAAPTAPDIDQTRFVQVTPSPDADPDATIADIEKLDSTAIGLKDIQGKDGGNFQVPPDNPFDDGDGRETDPEPKDTIPDHRSFVPLDKDPRPVNLDEIRKSIGYPKLAMEAEIEGRVTLRVLIDKNGKYQRHVVTSVAHKLLVDAVVAKIPMLEMTPGIQGNKPIPVWVTVPFEFKLKQKAEKR